jgi:flagellar basal-body rod protein FlgB
MASFSDLPILGMLKTRMGWHQERQRLLSENVANADTPKFRPRDLGPLQFGRDQPVSAVDLSRTAVGHIAASTANSSSFGAARAGGYDIRPSGNAVNLEDEMLKVASNQMDYQAATTLYTRSLGLIKTAIGKR